MAADDRIVVTLPADTHAGSVQLTMYPWGEDPSTTPFNFQGFLVQDPTPNPDGSTVWRSTRETESMGLTDAHVQIFDASGSPSGDPVVKQLTIRTAQSFTDVSVSPQHPDYAHRTVTVTGKTWINKPTDGLGPLPDESVPVLYSGGVPIETTGRRHDGQTFTIAFVPSRNQQALTVTGDDEGGEFFDPGHYEVPEPVTVARYATRLVLDATTVPVVPGGTGRLTGTAQVEKDSGWAPLEDSQITCPEGTTMTDGQGRFACVLEEPTARTAKVSVTEGGGIWLGASSETVDVVVGAPDGTPTPTPTATSTPTGTPTPTASPAASQQAPSSPAQGSQAPTGPGGASRPSAAAVAGSTGGTLASTGAPAVRVLLGIGAGTAMAGAVTVLVARRRRNA